VIKILEVAFMKQCLSLLLPATILIVISMQSAQAAEPQGCNLVEPPTTPVELIQNIKCAVARNIFFEDDIFTNDEKLWKLTGGDMFSKSYPIQADYNSLGIMRFPNSIDKLKKNSWLDQLGIGIDQQISPTFAKDIHKEIRINIGNAAGLQLHFDDIVKLFGADWTAVEDVKVYSRSSSPMHIDKAIKKAQTTFPALPTSNVIGYSLQARPPVYAFADVFFDNDGIFYQMEVTIVEKE
jgi:hypothetical protein